MAPDQALPRTTSDSTIRSVYSRIARLYGTTVERLTRPSRRRAIDLLELEPGDVALDVGCGAGGGVLELAEAVGEAGTAVGIDLAPGMVRETRRRAENANRLGRTAAIEGDARRLPIRSDSVDAVLLSEVLELFDAEDAPRVLSEIDRVLDEDGRLCVVSMDRSGAEGTLFLRLYEWIYRTVPGGDAFGCRPIYVARTLSGAGFEVETTERVRIGVEWPVTIVLARPGRSQEEDEATSESRHQ